MNLSWVALSKRTRLASLSEYLQVVSSILLKTLMTLPSGHFTLCKSLIDGRMQDEVEIGRVIYLHRLLVTCEFSLFWKEIEATPQLIE